ncbi:MAG: nickel pincer cofactor biosynthesis protein LarB [Myxococcales bacterium]|jgi:NCAIR mutase (PurE)-related protein|nr:nickel pincer cofactor biosynthesis protein LarB [Myxococcales bacterium]
MTDARCEDLGFAKLDLDRERRRGFGEVIFGAGKTEAQLLEIFRAFQKHGRAVLATRCTPQQAEHLRAHGLTDAVHDEVSRTITLRIGVSPDPIGRVAICTGGTADIAVAEEAARTAEFFGASVRRFYDVGIAGIHRLFANIEEIRQTNAIVAVAGMEGALAGVIAGLVDSPVIAVPTSVGYGASFQGVAPLLTMLNSCAEGIAVVNIDNGFGAGYLAAQINRKIEKIGAEKR